MSEIDLKKYNFIKVGELVLGVPIEATYWYEVASTGALKFPIEILGKADKRLQKLVKQRLEAQS